MATSESEYDRLVEAIAIRLARLENQPLAVARFCTVRMLDRAQQRYRDEGAPYGDTIAGFLKWWFERF
jgi:hypothetical protein